MRDEENACLTVGDVRQMTRMSHSAISEWQRKYYDLQLLFAATILSNGGELKIRRRDMVHANGEIVAKEDLFEDTVIYVLRKGV